MSALRSTVSTLLIILGLAVTAVAIPSTWLKSHVLDTEEWTAAVSPLIHEKPVQREVSAALVGAVDQEGRLPSRAREILTRVTDKVVATDSFADVWAGAVEISHVQLLEGIRGEGTGLDVSGEVVAVELAPLFEALVPRLAEAGVPGLDALPAPDGRVLLEGTEATAQVLQAAGVVDRLAWPLVAVAAGLVLLGVLLSRRPGLALTLAGVGVMGVAALAATAWGLAMADREQYFAGTVGSLLLDALTVSVEPWLFWSGAIGVALTVLGGLLWAMGSAGRKA